MSTAAVSGVSLLQELQSFYQTRQSDLKQLGTALQSGNLNAASQAFSALQTLGHGGPFSTSEPFGKASRAEAFEAIGQALQSGDLSGAKSAFAALTARGSIVPPPPTPAVIVNLSTSNPSASNLLTTPSTSTPSASSIYQQLQAYQQQRHVNLAQLGQALQSGDVAGAQTAFHALVALGQNGPYKNGATFANANRAQDFQAIGEALQSGDLAGAQAAFANLASTFGDKNQQAQNAINVYNGVYNGGGTEIVINFNVPQSDKTGTSSTGTAAGTTRFIGPPVQQQPPAPDTQLVGPPVPGQPPLTPAPAPGTTPEIVINLGGATGTSSGNVSGSQPEVVINLGQSSGSTEIDIHVGKASSPGSPSATAPEIQINVGQGSSGSGEQITINSGNSTSNTEISIGVSQSSGSSSQATSNNEQVAITLNQNKNFELIVNLLNSAAGPTQPASGTVFSLQA